MIRTVPAAGYATLWPLRALPATAPLALAAAGVRPAAFRAAWGYAAVAHRRDGTATPVRLRGTATRQVARAQARALLPACACPACAGPPQPGDATAVDLYRAVAVGAADRVLWERVERLEPVAHPRRRDWWVTKAGERRPLDAAEQEDAAIAALADRLAAIRAEWSEAELLAFWRRLEQENWATATETQREAAWAAALAAFAQADVRALLAPWRAAITADAGAWAAATRAQLQEALFPTIDAALSQVDTAAVNAVGEQAGLFVRDALGQEAAWLTARGREVVARGLRDGLGREAIAADLRAALPEMWAAYGENYSRVVASNAMVRARSISQAASYRDAGVDRYEIMAVMDERTTVTCFSGEMKVRTPRGEVEIKDVTPGMSIINGSGVVGCVQAVSRRIAREIYRLILSSGRRIMVTGEHPLLTARGWCKAENVLRGDHLAEQGVQKTGGVAEEDLRPVRTRIRSTRYLRGSWASSVLLDGVLAYSPNQGRSPRRSASVLRHLRKGILYPSILRPFQEASVPLFDGMSKTEDGTRLQGVRGFIRSRRDDGFPTEVLLDRVSGAEPIRNDVRAARYGRPVEDGPRVRTGEGRRAVLRRPLCSSLELGDRDRRRLLARPGQGFHGGTNGGAEGQGTRYRGQRLVAMSDQRGKHAEVSKARACERRPSEYLRGASGLVAVVGKERLSGEFVVYNLEMVGDPTYVVEGCIVHNCQGLNGEIITVAAGSAVNERAAAADTVASLNAANPFVRTALAEDGRRVLRTDAGVDLMYVEEGGGFERLLTGDALATTGNIGFPPYHMGCRTTTVPA